jgi:hypothetical protein
MGSGWSQRQRRRPVGMLPNIVSMQNVLAEDEREGQEEESATHPVPVVGQPPKLPLTQPGMSGELPAGGGSASQHGTSGPLVGAGSSSHGEPPDDDRPGEAGSSTRLKPVAAEVVAKAGTVVSTVALTMSEASRSFVRQLTGGSTSGGDKGAGSKAGEQPDPTAVQPTAVQAPARGGPGGVSGGGNSALSAIHIGAIRTAAPTASQPPAHHHHPLHPHPHQEGAALSDPEDDRRLSHRHPHPHLGGDRDRASSATRDRDRPSRERSSAVARFMRSASQRVAAALMPGGRGGGEEEDAEARRQQLKESAVQVRGAGSGASGQLVDLCLKCLAGCVHLMHGSTTLADGHLPCCSRPMAWL